MKSCRAVIAFGFVLTAVTWIFQCTHWWAHFDGDNPLYSMMSLEVLRGHQFLMTAGQSHGGTPLVYLRAGLFALIGFSRFFGYYLNGLTVAVAVGLWSRFAFRVAGPWAGYAMALLGGLGTECLVRVTCTDYYALSLVMGGLMLNAADHFARKGRVQTREMFGLGLLVGLSWYVCRLTFLYLIPAAAFLLVLSEPHVRALLVPGRELRKSKTSRLLSTIATLGFICAALAFLSSDRFFGMNAEVTLKISCALIAVLWLKHRWQLVLMYPGRLAAFAAGAFIGYLPELAFKLASQSHDRTTGLVRWSDLAAQLSEVPFRIGSQLSWYHPLTYGLTAAGCYLVVIGTGLVSRKRRVVAASASGLAVAFGAWIGVHTYMYLVVQYLVPALFPLFLTAALALGVTPYRRAAILAMLPIVFAAAGDLVLNVTASDPIAQARVLEKLDEWSSKYGVDRGFATYPSNYNIMYSARGRWMLPYREDPERFAYYQQAAASAPRIVYVYRAGDRGDRWGHPGYEVLEKADLELGYSLELLKRLN